MTAYVVFQGEVADAHLYEQYKPLAADSVERHGGSYLVRGGDWITMEGKEPPTRNVIIRFPSMEAAKAWYNSVEYSAARPLRQEASTGSLYIIEG
tara:strand:+ start:760 stop:1044 length:285 start_codon:yes stop_codon:yes gene_type:complete